MLVGTGEIFKKARNLLKFGHFGGSNIRIKSMGILRDFPLSYQTLIRFWVILGKLYVDLANFGGTFFLGGVG